MRSSLPVHWLWLMAGAVVCAYYLWNVRATGERFVWDQTELPGYYDYLGRALAGGHLYLPIQPPAKLLAYPNPLDPAVDRSLKTGISDMALYQGRLYLYHGAGPAVILFAPWRLLTGHDLPENFALFLFCLGGFLFSCGTLLYLLELVDARPGPFLLTWMLLTLGICQSVPYLQNRVLVYEIAIGGGYFFCSGAFFFLARAAGPGRNKRWLALSGLMFGLAVACRPHFVLVAAIACVAVLYLIRARGVPFFSMDSLAFVTPLVMIGLVLAAYNYERFGNIFEFGLRYLLAGGHNQNRIRLTWGYAVPGFYYWLFSRPDFSFVFPWVRLAFRSPFGNENFVIPDGYFLEPIAGALYLAPFVIGALFVPSALRVAKKAASANSAAARTVLLTLVACAVVVLFFLMASGFTTQRYEVDFLPMFVLAALVTFAIYADRSARVKRTVLKTLLSATIAFGIIVNMALGIAGPYNEMLKNRTADYLRIASWFSPMPAYRPQLNPPIAVAFTAEFSAQPMGIFDPLVTIGHRTYGDFLYVEHRLGGLRLVSQTEDSTVSSELPELAGKPAEIAVNYAPDSGNLSVSINRQVVLMHHTGTLLTAPAQVTIGENRIDRTITLPRFTGRIRDLRKTVGDVVVVENAPR